MTNISESAIEVLAIERLGQLGYHYLPGAVIAPDSDTPERARFEEVN